MPATLSLRQERALAITPKCTASLSMPCSFFILYEIYSDHVHSNNGNAISRAIFGMTIIDIMSSSAWWLSSWAVPKGGFALAAGNRASCTYQGFLLQLAVGAPLYNCSLALYYLLVIKFRWTDTMLRSIEKWVHGLILSFSVGTSFLLLPLKQYNQIGAVCWVIGDPAECDNSSFHANPDVPCERGEHAYIYGMALFYGPLWICIIACIISMICIHHEVVRTQRRLKRYSINGRLTHTLGRSGADSSRVATQAILYSLSFVITWLPSTLWSIAHWFNWSAYWLDFLAAFCEPLQGFWNFVIFVRKRRSTIRKLKNLRAFILPCFFSPVNEEEDVSRSRARSVSHVNTTSAASTNFMVESNENFSYLKQVEESLKKYGPGAVANIAGVEKSNDSFETEIVEVPSLAFTAEDSQIQISPDNRRVAFSMGDDSSSDPSCDLDLEFNIPSSCNNQEEEETVDGHITRDH